MFSFILPLLITSARALPQLQTPSSSLSTPPSSPPTSFSVIPSSTAVSSVIPPVSSSAPAPPAANTTIQSKTGLAWPNGDGIDIKPFLQTGKVSWYYSWSTWGGVKDIEFVPMFWGRKSIEDFATINETIAEYNVSHIIGFNEPNEPGQSNLTAQEGAELWKTYLEPLKAQGIRLGSPSPTSGPDGIPWLKDFFNACAGGCSVDYIIFHYYGVNATAFKQRVIDYHNTFQRPIWITEWACQNFVKKDEQCSQNDIVLFMNETQTFLDTTDYVERYSWFGSIPDMQGVNQFNALMDPNGQITDLGRQYIGLQPPKLTGSGNADGPNAPGGGVGPGSGSGEPGNGNGNGALGLTIPSSAILVISLIAAFMTCM